MMQVYCDFTSHQQLPTLLSPEPGRQKIGFSALWTSNFTLPNGMGRKHKPNKAYLKMFAAFQALKMAD